MAFQRKTDRLHQMLSVLALIALSGCGAGPSTTEVWTESAIAILGGTIQATQGDGSIARQQIDLRNRWEKMADWFNPIQEAMAAVPDCPTITSVAACIGTSNEILQTFDDQCFGKGMQLPMYRRHYQTWTFPTGSNCSDAIANGFAGVTITNMIGKKITRGYGYSNTDQNTDQVNFALGSKGDFAAVYTAFPSGHFEDRVGGVDVTFRDANTRVISITGVHVEGYLYHSIKYAGADGMDLLTESTGARDSLWDHTLNTVKSGDTIFENGPDLSSGPNGGVSWAGEAVDQSPTSPADGDAIVTGYGTSTKLLKGAAVRTQHNHSSSIGISVVTEDLVYSDPTCCWPVSGAIHTEFDRFYAGDGKMPWPFEDVTFTGDCGKISYETSEGDTGVTQLQHCY